MKTDIPFKKYKRYYTYIPPFLKTKIVRNYTYLILTFFTTAFFAFSAIKPTINTIMKLRRQIIDARISEQKLQEKINALSSGQDLLSTIGNDIEIIESSLPSQPEIGPFVKQIENLAAANLLSFQSLSFGSLPLRKNSSIIKIKPRANLQECSFNFSLRGYYENLLRFLENSQNLRRFLIFEDIHISKGKDKEDKNILVLTAKAKIFYRD